MITAKRVGTGVWIAAATAGVFLADWALGTHWATAVLIGVASCGALHELYLLLERGGLPCHRLWGTTMLAAALFLRAAGPELGLSAHEARELSLAVFVLGFLGPVIVAVVRADRELAPDPEAVRRVAATALGFGYVGILSTFLLELRMLDLPRQTGLELTFLLFLSVKVGDSLAYFVGRSVGRTPLTPVSPKKTWEGSIASVVGSVGCAVAAGAAFEHDLRVMAGFGLVVDLAGQGGDLLESWFKRTLGTKDSAKTFGEMGGFFDLMDALLVAAPVAWLWGALLIARGG